MKLESLLAERSAGKCELCGSPGPTQLFEVPGGAGRTPDTVAMLCAKCIAQIEKREEPDSSHWSVLPETMWSDVPAVQVLAWRMLNRLRNESWAADSLDLLYLDEDKLAWAKSTGDHEGDGSVDLHKDANGYVLQKGDTVVLTKSLDVKGSSLNAKLGTVVRNIRLVEENTAQIEGKIEGQTIVILTKYVRRQNS